MYSNFKPGCDDVAGSLPDNWKERKSKAELIVNQALTKMNIHASKSDRATLAKGIIRSMKENMKLSVESKNILADAFRFVNKGNLDIIKKIIAIDKELQSKQGNLFSITQEEIDYILNNEIAQIVSHVQGRYGKAEVYMALSK